jgi:hypothetical protein
MRDAEGAFAVGSAEYVTDPGDLLDLAPGLPPIPHAARMPCRGPPRRLAQWPAARPRPTRRARSATGRRAAFRRGRQTKAAVPVPRC